MALSLNLSLRAVTSQDEQLLRAIYASTRDDELALVDWDEATKAAFLDQQFRAQHVHYTGNYPPEDLQVIEVDGEPVGRLYVGRSDAQVSLLDIAVLPPFRNRGIGTGLVRALMDEAGTTERPLRLHVEMFNEGARRLYDRLGFRPIETQGVYVLMEWTALVAEASASTRRDGRN